MSEPIHHGIAELFPTDPTGLPEVIEPSVQDLVADASFALRIAPVAKRLRDTTVRMLAYNDSIPGPIIKVRQGSEITVLVTNDGDVEATVHWHGLRLENRYDGVPHETQKPIPVGGSFTYRVRFPDAGLYWYHPHIREDYTQEMGLYGNILVVPAEPNYWPPVNREVVLTLDDILIEDGKVAPFSRSQTTYAAMGRYGNLMLVAGEPDLSLTTKVGGVVRLYLTNTANTRVFNVYLPGARMKLVGGDSGRYEREQFVESVLLGPSERAVVDVSFARPGELTLEHRTPDRIYPLARIAVTDERVVPSLEPQFAALRSDPELVGERQRLAPILAAEPDKVLAIVAEMDDPGISRASNGPVVYACPVHPEVVSDVPGCCPICGMKLLVAESATQRPVGADASGTLHDMGGTHGRHGRGPDTADGIEWEDDMAEVNRRTTDATMRWKLVDRITGAENGAIDWRFRVGERVKIRLVNEMDSDHPMAHPFHIHGAGRFLVLSRDGIVEPNLVWKDTVLARTGQVVDILLDVSNPGLWMAHCHIAEHLQSGMMFSFRVGPDPEETTRPTDGVVASAGRQPT